MTTLHLVQGIPQPAAVPTLESALSATLRATREGTLSVAGPGDAWLALRLEEALDGFQDIQQMAIGDEPAMPIYSANVATASILAQPARAAS